MSDLLEDRKVSCFANNSLFRQTSQSLGIPAMQVWGWWFPDNGCQKKYWQKFGRRQIIVFFRKFLSLEQKQGSTQCSWCQKFICDGFGSEVSIEKNSGRVSMLGKSLDNFSQVPTCHECFCRSNGNFSFSSGKENSIVSWDYVIVQDKLNKCTEPTSVLIAMMNTMMCRNGHVNNNALPCVEDVCERRTVKSLTWWLRFSCLMFWGAKLLWRAQCWPCVSHFFHTLLLMHLPQQTANAGYLSKCTCYIV